MLKQETPKHVFDNVGHILSMSIYLFKSFKSKPQNAVKKDLKNKLGGASSSMLHPILMYPLAD